MSWVGVSAAEIAEAVRRGKVTAPVVVEEHLDAIAVRDGRIGAFRKVRVEQALAEARAVQGREDLAGLPLAGVPIAIKDNVAIRGEASRNGSAATPDAPAPEDHPVVARLRAAGAVVVGITNVSGALPGRILRQRVRHGAQPMGPRAHSGRVVRWERGGRGRGDGAAGPR